MEDRGGLERSGAGGCGEQEGAGQGPFRVIDCSQNGADRATEGREGEGVVRLQASGDGGQGRCEFARGSLGFAERC